MRSGTKVEELYREIRALRIYEGASEVQKIVIARAALAASLRRGISQKGGRMNRTGLVDHFARDNLPPVKVLAGLPGLEDLGYPDG